MMLYAQNTVVRSLPTQSGERFQSDKEVLGGEKEGEGESALSGWHQPMTMFRAGGRGDIL
jgi:hypothetical protein